MERGRLFAITHITQTRAAHTSSLCVRSTHSPLSRASSNIVRVVAAHRHKPPLMHQTVRRVNANNCQLLRAPLFVKCATSQMNTFAGKCCIYTQNIHSIVCSVAVKCIQHPTDSPHSFHFAKPTFQHYMTHCVTLCPPDEFADSRETLADDEGVDSQHLSPYRPTSPKKAICVKA